MKKGSDIHASEGRIRQIHQEHIDLLHALLKGDGELAGDLMRTHLSLSQDAHLRLLVGSPYDEARPARKLESFVGPKISTGFGA